MINPSSPESAGSVSLTLLVQPAATCGAAVGSYGASRGPATHMVVDWLAALT